MSTTTNVEFYEKLKDLQERQHDNEKRRHGLEQQLNTYIQSDHRLARLKAVRLQNYWKKICEDEKRSQWRNEQLLRDFDRVETHMATLNTRTERLRVMKKQYEDYIEKTYPNWKEKILHNQRLQHQVERQQQLQAEAEAQAQAAAAVVSPASIHGYVIMPDQREAYRISNTLPAPQTIPANMSLSESDMVRGGTVPFRGYSGLVVSEERQGGHIILSPGEVGQTREPAQAKSGNMGQPSTTHLSKGDYSFHAQAHEPNEGQGHAGRSHEPIAANVIIQHTEPPHATHGGNVHNGNEADVSSIEEDPVVAMVSPRRQGGYGDWNDLPKKTESPQKETSPQVNSSVVKPMTDDTDDFESDVSLPMSGADIAQPEPEPEPEPALKADSEEPPAPPSPVAAQVSADRAQTPDSLYMQPDITLDGLYNLMSAVEELLPAARQPRDLYRADTPRHSVKTEILQNASKGATLSHINGASISMMILEQLPLLVMSCEDRCLLPDSILFKPSSLATQDSIRANIHPASQSFWDRLCEHFLYLIKYDSMVPEEIGEMFGPLLISEDSPYEPKAQTLVKKVMESADPDVIKSPASTSTFSTLSPRKLTETDTRGKQQTEAAQHKPPVVPVPHNVEETVEEEDDFFNQYAPKQLPPTNQLTQSAAYRQLLGDTMSTTRKSVSYVDSDDSDDVEQQLGSVLPRKTKNETPKSPVQVPDKDKTDESGPLSPAGLSRVSSPDLGSTGGGYVPSGMDTGGKSGTSSLGSSGKKKGPAFKFQDESDTDEDIDILAMGSNEQKTTQKHSVADDGFDFYE